LLHPIGNVLTGLLASVSTHGLKNHSVKIGLQDEDLSPSTGAEFHTPETDVSRVRWKELIRGPANEAAESNMQCSYWAPKGRNTGIPIRVRLRVFVEKSNDKSIISFTWYIKQESFVIASREETLVTALRCHAKQEDNRARITNRSSGGAEGAALPEGSRGSVAEGA